MKTYIKNIIGFSVLMSACFTVSSCEDDRLDQQPDFLISSENITTEVQLDGVVKGMYSAASNANAFGARIHILGDLISDNTFVSETQNTGRYLVTNVLNWTFENSDGEFGQLSSLNGIIAMANIALNSNITDFESEQSIANLKGQAYIARGLSYFYLVNFYSSNPTSGMHQEFGVPIYTGPYNPDYAGARNTVDEVYAQAISDLTVAISTMDNSAPLNKGYLSKTAAHLILSRIYLTRGKPGDYQLAVDHANQVINTTQSGFAFITDNPATEVNEYADYFANSSTDITENREETVWEINMTPGATTNPGTNEALGALYASTGSIFFKQDFRNSFPDSDIRKSLFGNLGPQGDSPRGVVLRKWPRLTSEGNFTINVKVLRMSEAKLNKIEALYHLGQTGEALTLLNQFAAERGGTTYSGTNLLNDILTERRKEFFGEGQRFFDLKRNNLPLIKTTNCMMNCEKPANDKIFTFPMPLQEMNLNLLMVQHPQWQ